MIYTISSLLFVFGLQISIAFADNWIFIDVFSSPSQELADSYCGKAAARSDFKYYKLEYEGPAYKDSSSWNCYGSN